MASWMTMALGEIANLRELREVVRNSESVAVCEPHHTAAWQDAYARLLACGEKMK